MNSKIIQIAVQSLREKKVLSGWDQFPGSKNVFGFLNF